MTDAPQTDPKTDADDAAAVAPLGDYSKEEITQLTRALAQVVLGAGMSEKSGSFGLMREVVAAMRASSIFIGDSSNPLLEQIVTAADPGETDDAEKDANAKPESAQKAMDDGIEAAKTTHAMLMAKGKEADADAWAQLLLTAANAAVQATKTGGFLGIGGEKVTPSEQAYMQRLADTLGYQKAS